MFAVSACLCSSSLQSGQITSSVGGRPVSRLLSPEPIRERSATDAAPLKIKAEITREKYCADSDGTYNIIFSLHMRFLNQTNVRLIVEKALGHGLYHITVTGDAKNLAAGDHEYDSNEDWIFGQVPPETPEQFKSPGPNFAILNPGESLDAESDFWAMHAGSQRDSAENRSPLKPGSHFLQVTLATWNHHTEPEEVRKRWEPFGDLIYKPIKTEPLAFNLPRDPKVENCKPQ
jgi:hypothetical protein